MPSFFSKKKPSPNPNTTSTSTNTGNGNNNSIRSDIPPADSPPLRSPTTSTKSTTTTTTTTTSPNKEKKSRGYFVKEREKELRRGSQSNLRTTSSSSKSGSNNHKSGSPSRRRASESHPLNLPPDELRRLSALSAMSSPRSEDRDAGVGVGVGPGNGNDSDAMETSSTPGPEEMSGAFPTTTSPINITTNGINGEDSSAHESSSSADEARPVPPPHRTPTSPTPTPPPPPKPEIRPEEAEEFKAAGNQFYKAGKYGSAIDEYTKAIEANPSSSTYISNRAAAYMAAGQYSVALEDCKQAEELESGNAKILHRLAKVYTALGRPQEALEVYDRVQPAATAKDKAAAQSMQSHLSQAEESLHTSTSGSMVLYALDQAEKSLGSSVQPPRKWRLMRGEAYLKMGTVNSIGDAQNVAMSLLRWNNADPEALVLRGRALYASGENDKAIQHFRQAISCDPDFKLAVKYLRMVQKLDKLKEEGNSHFKAGRYQPAMDIYTTALDIDPLNKGTNSKILNNRAMCYSRLKQYPAAIQDCDRAIQLDPTYTKAQKTRAKALGESGDWDEAVRAYKNIQEHNAEEPGIAKDIRNAELELKKSKRKDYYKILGVEKDAGEMDIKKAYRKLAVVHHPDKNPGDAEAENRFKDIQEAHETLIDPQKRERYDSGVDLMDPADAFGGGGGFHGGFGGGGVQIDPEMLFNMMGGGRPGGGGGGGGGFPFATGGGGGRPGFATNSGFSPFG